MSGPEVDLLQVDVVFVKRPGDILKLRQADPQGQCYCEKRSHGRILGKDIVQPLAPSLVEPDAGGDFVGCLKGRRQACLQRPFVQYQGGEGVEGANGSLVEVGDSLPAAVTLLFPSGRVFSGLLQVLTDAVPELGGGRLGESDRCDAVQGGTSGSHQVDDAPHQAGSLAGAGTGFDEQRVVQTVENVLASVVIAGLKYS